MLLWKTLWKPLLAPARNSSFFGLPTMGLALATLVFAIGSTCSILAFQLPLDANTRSMGRKKEDGIQSTLPYTNTRIRWMGPPTPFLFGASAMSVQCEAQPHGEEEEKSSSTPVVNGFRLEDSMSSSSSSSALSKQLSASLQYERMNPPSRMDWNSHAVSQLLQPDKIARYEIFKKKLSDPDDSLTNIKNVHIVTALVDFGTALDGHPSIVHGGIVALVLDDVFGFSFEAMGVPMAVTANLNLNYRAPTPAGTSVLIRVYLERQENRKLYFQANVTSLDGSVVYADSTCLYIIPRSVWETIEQNHTTRDN